MANSRQRLLVSESAPQWAHKGDVALAHQSARRNEMLYAGPSLADGGLSGCLQTEGTETGHCLSGLKVEFAKGCGNVTALHAGGTFNGVNRPGLEGQHIRLGVYFHVVR
jgi:hypothetical protein